MLNSNWLLNYLAATIPVAATPPFSALNLRLSQPRNKHRALKAPWSTRQDNSVRLCFKEEVYSYFDNDSLMQWEVYANCLQAAASQFVSWILLLL